MTVGTRISERKSNTGFSHFSVFAMNTELNMILCDTDTNLCNFIFESVSSLVSKYEQALSRYNPNAELYNVNRLATKYPVYVSKILWEAILIGIEYYQLTGGYFDISLGKVYHGHKSGDIFNKEIVPELINYLEIDIQSRTIFFGDENISLDFGGIGKGIVLNEIGQLIDKYKVTNALVSFGGSSILARGKHPHGNCWPFSLRNDSKFVWELNNDTVSVSSTRLEPQNQAIAHIINPYISRTIKAVKTSVVKSKDPIQAEVLSTTLLAAPEPVHRKIISAFHQAEYKIS